MKVPRAKKKKKKKIIIIIIIIIIMSSLVKKLERGCDGASSSKSRVFLFLRRARIDRKQDGIITEEIRSDIERLE